MAANSGRLDHWRNYFRGANSDIFEVIEYAIIVAASDCPQEFRLRRDRIAERLFSCRLTKCSGCDRVELAVPEEEVEYRDLKGGFGGQGGVEAAGSGAKESKVNSSTDDRGDLHQFSNFSYNEAEALTDEIEEKNLIVAEVFRIKDVLNNFAEESESVLFESLRRLQLMELSVETLKITEIGKAVNGIRKHKSKQIRQLSRTLIDEWKAMVDEWVNAATAIAGNYMNDENSPDSLNPSVGLPSPPLDEGIFLATQTTSMELSQFFDGMDDDGLFRNFGAEEFFENEMNPVVESPIQIKKEQNPVDHNAQKVDHGYLRKPEPASKPPKTSTAVSLHSRPQKPTLENKSNGDIAKLQQRAPDKMQKKPSNGSNNKSQLSDEDASVQVKLEATKRKLQEGYQLAENAKRQRTIQVMELRDLPKQSLGQRNLHHKPGSHNRHFSHGRR